jgi:hypothetical protein
VRVEVVESLADPVTVFGDVQVGRRQQLRELVVLVDQRTDVLGEQLVVLLPSRSPVRAQTWLNSMMSRFQ